MVNSKDCSFLPHRILTRGCAFAFFVTAILSTSISFAAVVGTEDFDGNKSGWNWDGGTAQDWTVSSGSFTREDDGTGNMRAKVNGQAYLGYGTSDQLTSGTFAYTFDLQLPSVENTWGGLSLYKYNDSNSTEITFFGKVTESGSLVLRRVNPNPILTDYSGDSHLGTNKTYAVVANSTGMFAWEYDLGTPLKYEDLFTEPKLHIDATLTGNNRFRLGTSNTIYVDNIKMAYSDSSTVTSKGDATKVSSLTDVFGAVPIVPCIQEAFSNYEDDEDGAIVGQFQQNLGQAPLTKWSKLNNNNSSATVDSSHNLEYPGWSSEQGVLNVSNGKEARMTLDPNVMDSWGVLGSDGKIGGDNISKSILYYGFLMQIDGATGWWSNGPELFRGDNEVLSLGYHQWTSSTDFAGYYRNPSNTEYRLDFANDKFDSDTHLFVVKLIFGENGAGDDALIFIDPNMALSEENQDPDHVYKLSELTGLSNLDLSFDNLVYRGERAFTIDEFRMAKSWESLADVPEPSTWALLLLGAAGLMYVRKRK